MNRSRQVFFFFLWNGLVFAFANFDIEGVSKIVMIGTLMFMVVFMFSILNLAIAWRQGDE